VENDDLSKEKWPGVEPGVDWLRVFQDAGASIRFTTAGRPVHTIDLYNLAVREGHPYIGDIVCDRLRGLLERTQRQCGLPEFWKPTLQTLTSMMIGDPRVFNFPWIRAAATFENMDVNEFKASPGEYTVVSTLRLRNALMEETFLENLIVLGDLVLDQLHITRYLRIKNVYALGSISILDVDTAFLDIDQVVAKELEISGSAVPKYHASQSFFSKVIDAKNTWGSERGIAEFYGKRITE
jgi:hypothetical protein